MKAVGRGPWAALATIWVAACGDATGPQVEGLGEPWEGLIEQGATLEILGVNGAIEATRAAGSSAAVSTVKRGHDDDPADVRIEIVTHSGGVTICAVYPSPPGEPPNECAPGGTGRMTVRNNDVEVDFTVKVPEGVQLAVANVNGAVRAEGLASRAFLATVNGDVLLSTTRLGTATSVNGDVVGEIGLADWDRDLSFTTVNGDVSLTVPAATNADAVCTTVNGNLSSDFSGTSTGAGIMSATLGSGGWRLTLAAVNGNVRLYRGA